VAWPLPQIKVTLDKGVAYFFNQVNKYVLGYGDIGDCSMVKNLSRCFIAIIITYEVH